MIVLSYPSPLIFELWPFWSCMPLAVFSSQISASSSSIMTGYALAVPGTDFQLFSSRVIPSFLARIKTRKYLLSSIETFLSLTQILFSMHNMITARQGHVLHQDSPKSFKALQRSIEINTLEVGINVNKLYPQLWSISQIALK